MFKDFELLSSSEKHDICIVGSGPVGIAVALACEEAGLRVLLLESGKLQPDSFSASLTNGHSVDPARHAGADVAICRALGGTSRWWGGRCVAFDEIDFADRSFAPDARWPISFDEVSRWYPKAAKYLGVGSAKFSVPPKLTPDLGDIEFRSVERWTPTINMGKLHYERLHSSKNITVVLGATVLDLIPDASGSRVCSLLIAGQSGRLTLATEAIVVACGGLETARLLLNTQKKYPAVFEDGDTLLGRNYMGHLSGKIADLVLTNPRSVEDHDFFIDDGVFVRRRFAVSAEAQLREQLLNSSFWIDNPPFYMASHRNGVLSLVWLALAIPPLGRLLVSEGVRISHVGPNPRTWARHIWNVLGSPFATMRGILAILFARFLSRPARPGFLLANASGRYPLHYHAEHSPNPASLVKLGNRIDALGMPFLDISLLFTGRDAESIVKSHELIDQALRRYSIGHLEYYVDNREERISSVLAQATDGFHQAGTARMASSSTDGVVDSNCKVHGVSNLWLAGSSVFPSSGQANSTFLAVALALRLADHLADRPAKTDKALVGA